MASLSCSLNVDSCDVGVSLRLDMFCSDVLRHTEAKSRLIQSIIAKHHTDDEKADSAAQNKPSSAKPSVKGPSVKRACKSCV